MATAIILLQLAIVSIGIGYLIIQFLQAQM